MKTKINTITFLFCICFCINLNAQFFERFNIEIGANRSKIINTKSLFSERDLSRDQVNQNGYREKSAYSMNYSASLGINLFGNHSIRIKASKNKYGSFITGTIFSHMTNSFCGMGMNAVTFENAFNQITNTSIGLAYEFNYPLHYGRLTIMAGGERHSHNYVESFIFPTFQSFRSYAVHSSLGYLVPLHEYISFHGSVFFTKTIESSDSKAFEDHLVRKYVPLQIGIGVGFRVHLAKTN